MSVDLYQTGVSGLVSAQQQLATTGHNIANVNTEGYNRQRAEQETFVASSFGNNFLGSGTFINDVTRIYDQFTYKEQLANTSKLGAAKASESSLSQLNDILSTSGNALTSSINLFYQAFNGIADNPSDAGLRNIALSQAEIVASDFRSLNENFGQLEKSTNNEIVEIANQISQVSVEIAKINEQILNNNNLTQKGQPNDLLDRRDQLVTELAKYTTVNTVTDNNGVMTVMIGSGSTLVAGITPLSLQVRAGDPDPTKTQLLLSGANSSIALDQNSLGGELSSKLAFRDEHIFQAKSQIDRLALAFSETINVAQSNGLDLNQAQGRDIFTNINATLLQQARVLSPSTNAGNLRAQVEITDASLLPTDEFQIDFDGTNYVATNLTTKATQTLTLTAANTYSSTQGFNFITTSGTAAVNDKFVVRTAENSAALMAVTLSNGNGIAASSPIHIQASSNNIGGGNVTVSDIYDPVGARAASNIEIEILESPSGTFSYIINDLSAGTSTTAQAYTPPSQFINIPPSPAVAIFQIEISGSPSGSAPFAPEKFVLSDGFGVGNGANASVIAASQEANILNKGQESFSENLNNTLARVGSKASTAELVSNTAEALHTQAYNRNQAVSGVNLDEEAANLIKFQQAYQAASQIISTANTIFDTLLSVTR